MASVTSFEIVLESSRDPGSVPEPFGDTPGQAPITSDTTRQSRSAVEGYLKTVIHGRVDGEERWRHAQTLIVAHFRFLSSPGGQCLSRFCVRFVPKDQDAFYIARIAPEGEIALYPDDDWNTGLFKGYTFGTPCWLDSPNSVEWHVTENAVQKSGIPPELTVALLLERQDDEPFVVEVQVDTTVGRGDDSSCEFDKIVPIHFDPKGKSIGLDTLPPETDINDLRTVYLEDLCQIGPVDSIETLRVQGYCRCGLRIL